MVTRETASVGVQGPEYAVDRYTAVYLSTVAGAQLHGEGDIAGSLQPGKLADVVGFNKDPMTCPSDELFDLRPSFTLVGGRPVFDPEGLIRSNRSHG
jgi:predicted amidohydrolase YtcJ